MRKVLPIILLGLIAFSFKAPKKIFGKWRISRVERESGVTRDNIKKWIHFKDEGKVEAGKEGRDANKFGTWSYNKASKTITLKTEDHPKDDGDYKVVLLKKDSLILHRNGDKIYLGKVQE